MPSRNKVVWTQGLFLQPHHFQQEARHFEQLVDARVRGTGPHSWGFTELVLDDGQLTLGRIALRSAAGVLPDGTPFAMPQWEAVPPPFEVPADLKGETIYLAVPVARSGVTEVDFGSGGDEMLRYRVATEELRDHSNAGDDPEPVQTAQLALRLIRARDLTDGFAALGVVRVIERRSDNQVVLERNYIAPQVRIEATGQLSATASLLHGLIQQRSRLLASRMGQLGGGTSEFGEFVMLQSLNRAEPLFRQLAGAPSAHPREFYFACLQLAGELATFSTSERHPPEYPVYKHDELQQVFLSVVEDLRRLLSIPLERHAEQIELTEHKHGVRTAVVKDLDLLKSAGFVLAVTAQLPAEQLRQRFPSQSKLGPVAKLRDLVNLQLPGVALRSLPVAPRQLPFHAGYHYFELDKGGELWKQLERDGNLALHVAGDFPGLDIELWAIRQG
jgi:type VI secretion system protein ImpJ